MNRKFYPLILIIIALAAFGLMSKIINDPIGVLTTVAFGALIIGIFVLLYRKFRSQRDGGESSSYQRAVKQSAKKYKKQQKNKQTKRPSHLKVINTRPFQGKRQKSDPSQKRKSDHNLTVIDGKKRKKKNRASF